MTQIRAPRRHPTRPSGRNRLSPWPVRLVVFLVLAALALWCIRHIDARAMATMRRAEAEAEARRN